MILLPGLRMLLRGVRLLRLLLPPWTPRKLVRLGGIALALIAAAALRDAAG